MREKYFSKENIGEKSKLIQTELEIKGLLREGYSIPKTTALLILDMQEYFLAPESHAFIPSAEAIIPKINLLIEEFVKRDMPILFTQHIDQKAGEGLMRAWWKNNILEDNPLKSISPNIRLDQSETIIKTQYDAFWNTDLQNNLEMKGVTDIVITGVMTHLCCETTARSAFVRGFNVIFPIDGTATYNKEHHMGTLRNLSHGFAHIQTNENLIACLP